MFYLSLCVSLWPQCEALLVCVLVASVACETKGGMHNAELVTH